MALESSLGPRIDRGSGRQEPEGSSRPPPDGGHFAPAPMNVSGLVDVSAWGDGPTSGEGGVRFHDLMDTMYQDIVDTCSGGVHGPCPLCRSDAVDAVDAVVVEGRSLRSVASSLDMSKSWVAKQVSRYHSGGYDALALRSTAPHGRPTQIPVDLENEIVTLGKQLDEEGLDAGPLTIQYHLGRRHGTAPGRSTIHRALVRRGFVTPQPQKRPRSSWQRFEAGLPNETWQADMTHWSIDDGTAEGMKVETLDFVDDYSRMVVAAVVVPVATAADVVAAFYKGASTWGFPASITTFHAVCGEASISSPISLKFNPLAFRRSAMARCSAVICGFPIWNLLG